jgi:hypothetical protein
MVCIDSGYVAGLVAPARAAVEATLYSRASDAVSNPPAFARTCVLT